MGEQFLTLGTTGVVAILAEVDVVPGRESLGIESRRGLVRRRVIVDPDIAEIGSKRRLHRLPGLRSERSTTCNAWKRVRVDVADRIVTAGLLGDGAVQATVADPPA